MDSWFYKLGSAVRPAAQKGKWMWKSLTSDAADAIRAEYNVGREMAVKFEHEADIDTDPAVAALLTDVGGRLTRCVKDKQRRFTFRTVCLSEINAFALPGGFVFVTRSLLEHCGWRTGSPPSALAEVAFILGHEMAHVMRGHAMRRMVKSGLIHAAARASPVGVWMGRLLLQAGSQFLNRTYTRDQELEADALGSQLAGAAGFDPQGAINVLTRLKHLSDSDGQDKVDAGSYIAAHPPIDVRVENLYRLRGVG